MFQNPPFEAPDGAKRDAVQKPAISDPQRIDSRRLMAGSREVVIEHAGQAYRLRLTRNDKLILTK